ncbi:hypothetical protein [Chondromyces apiculatus]|uniref:Lipoprotein n=1 Tax=Chondromyces apiculatus DSM 436 TaxID=1192034 RepID=A0A017SZC1_9BACT|nr:hypothetical protein [Chondromyces apiculatus]EYF02344.1 Hypothetical protein CAP_7273 [Chondromyces apiculatus DSM 436]
MISKCIAALTVSLLVSLVACAPPPKQADVPEVQSEGGEDMAPTESGAEPTTGAAPAPEEMRTKCCVECKAGLAKDRTGAAPDTIPCADYTDTLSPWCLEHFRANPLMASKCE